MRSCERRSDNKSGYMGVCWNKHAKKRMASIRNGGRRIHLGYYNKAIEAAKAYNLAAILYHREFAKLNEL